MRTCLTGRTLRLACWLVIAGLAVAGCDKPKPTGGGGAGGGGGESVYNPKNDPLVNPEYAFAPPPDDRSAIETDETLYLQLDGNPNTMVPIFVSSMADFTVAEGLYSSLFTFDKDMKWMLNDDVVESLEESDDHKTFTVRMKPGLTWHDGNPFTAHDVAYSWKEILDPRVPCPAVKQGTDHITECKALDDLTVQFYFDEPRATSKWDLLFPILPKHVYEKDKQDNPDLTSGDYYANLSRNPVGNGPYRLTQWKENDLIVMERWDGWKGEVPHFKRIVFRIVPDNTVALLMFEKQDVDCLERMTSEQFAKDTVQSETFKQVGYKVWAPEWSVSYIGWNMDGSNPYFTDKRVRQAMAHAYNQDLIIEKIGYNLPIPSKGMFHPDSWMFNPDVVPFKYDLEKAAALLDEAGWTVDPDDGWRYRMIDGERRRFVFTLTIPQGSSASQRIAAIFQEDLKTLGVEMKTRTLEWAAFVLNNRNHEFEAQISAWGTGTDPTTNSNLFKSDQYEGGRNYGGYKNARVDELFELENQEFDPEKRRKIFQEIHQILYEDQVYLFSHHRPSLSALNKRLQGIQTSPRGLFNFNPSFLGWWVAKGEGRHIVAMKPQ